MICKCKGQMTQAVLPEYDFTPLVGLPVVVLGMPILRCEKCGEEMLDGPDVERVLAALIRAVTELPRRLGPKQARFLRGQLGLTQKALAQKMGLHTITVAGWESTKTISPQNDYILRSMIASAKLRPAFQDKTFMALAQVHKEKPRRTPSRIVLDKKNWSLAS
jgi:YgiT-type zinc finger domain-containing protein